MLPLLALLGDGQEWRLREAVERLADQFDLSQEERAALLPSGRAAVFHDRVSWARTLHAQGWAAGKPAARLDADHAPRRRGAAPGAAAARCALAGAVRVISCLSRPAQRCIIVSPRDS